MSTLSLHVCFPTPKVRENECHKLGSKCHKLSNGSGAFFSPFQNHLRLTFSISSSFSKVVRISISQNSSSPNLNTLEDICE
eukprot:UN22025